MKRLFSHLPNTQLNKPKPTPLAVPNPCSIGREPDNPATPNPKKSTLRTSSFFTKRPLKIFHSYAPKIHHLLFTIPNFLLFLSACSPQVTTDQRIQSPSGDTSTSEARITGGSPEIIALYKTCLVCHSDRELQRGPKIDGLPAWYIAHQLEKFANGSRGQNPDNRSEHLMGSTRDQYQDPAIRKALSAHIASLTPQAYEPVVKADAKKGKPLYSQCAACHGWNAEGNEQLMAPPLNIQEDWYLLEQMRKFKSRQRGHHPDDYTGVNMHVMMQQVQTDSDLRHITAYLQTLSLSKSAE